MSGGTQNPLTVKKQIKTAKIPKQKQKSQTKLKGRQQSLRIFVTSPFNSRSLCLMYKELSQIFEKKRFTTQTSLQRIKQTEHTF